MAEWCSKVTGGGGQCGAVAYTPRTEETRTCQTSPVSGGDRSLTSCMHTHASPPVPYPPVYTHPSHPLTAVRPLLPLFGLCCLCSSSSFSRERTCRNANNNGPSAASHTYVHTYIHTDRQTERCTVSPCQLSPSPRAWPSVSPAHTHTMKTMTHTR